MCLIFLVSFSVIKSIFSLMTVFPISLSFSVHYRGTVRHFARLPQGRAHGRAGVGGAIYGGVLSSVARYDYRSVVQGHWKRFAIGKAGRFDERGRERKKRAERKKEGEGERERQRKIAIETGIPWIMLKSAAKKRTFSVLGFSSHSDPFPCFVLCA